MREYTLKAYDETRKRFKQWPRTLTWYDVDSRQFHRAIFFRAGLHIEDGEVEEGLRLYRKLLSMWPNDNIGARYYVAGVYAGKSIKEIGKMWERANEGQQWDIMEKMLDTQNRKHKFWEKPKF